MRSLGIGGECIKGLTYMNPTFFVVLYHAVWIRVERANQGREGAVPLFFPALLFFLAVSPFS